MRPSELKWDSPAVCMVSEECGYNFRMTGRLTDFSRQHHITLASLHWLPVCFTIDFYDFFI